MSGILRNSRGDAKPSIETINATGTGNITLSADPTGKARLVQVMVHFSVATTNDVTLTLDSIDGTAYDTVISVLTAGAGASDLLWVPEEDIFMREGDTIDCAWTNPGGTTYGITLIFENL